MRGLRTISLVLIPIILFWIIKFYFNFPNADVEIVQIILTVASILFGFLAGFFISELWTRYTEIRQLQSIRSADVLNMIKFAEHFSSNKKFEKEFKRLVEKSAVADEIVEWHQGHLEISYFRDIADSFKYLNPKNETGKTYLDNILNSYGNIVRATVRLDTLGKERLFPSEWFMMIALSLVVGLSILFLDSSESIYQIIIFTFPSIIVLALSIMYDLDRMLWSKEIVSLEPNARIFDAIGVSRFYLKKKKRFISKRIKNYRTENDLKGELKKIYIKIIKAKAE